jgi:putative ATP-dependent endonuclease of OLD family
MTVVLILLAAMYLTSVLFKGHRCFRREWAGFSEICPINVIIGRNNTGKSHLLDLAEALCKSPLPKSGWSYRCRGILPEEDLKRIFPPGTSGGDLGGEYWEQHGRHFVNVGVDWEINPAGEIEVRFLNGFQPPYAQSSSVVDGRIKRIKHILSKADNSNPLLGRSYRRLLADRDIRPEGPETALQLSAAGFGATNIIRKYLLTSNEERYPRKLIQQELLNALNKIFGLDGIFTEIQVKHHDEPSDPNAGSWEVFLGEEKKGHIALSSSGSGLKTIILVLLNLLIVPHMESKSRSQYVFAFEELENNLHPSLLRRLFRFLEEYAETEKSILFLTTHSSVALDLFGVSQQSQIIHVSHDGEAARSTPISAHFDRLGVVSELGAKPSDILQANCVIWVEGPSDCIYLSRWIDIFSGGWLREGRDFQCAFYGGALLARAQFASPEEAEAELVNLFRVNTRIVVICDGDRSGPRAKLKERVRRIASEVEHIQGACMWITQGREIENYIPGNVLAKAFAMPQARDPDRYEQFFARKGSPGHSYAETQLKRRTIDKVELAAQTAPLFEKNAMSGRFDWETQVGKIVRAIATWNE